jgi:hypothetical protein
LPSQVWPSAVGSDCSRAAASCSPRSIVDTSTAPSKSAGGSTSSTRVAPISMIAPGPTEACCTMPPLTRTPATISDSMRYLPRPPAVTRACCSAARRSVRKIAWSAPRPMVSVSP